MRDELLIAILAAGASRRLGQPKQLIKLGGETLVRRQCRVAIEAQLGPVGLIVGCQADACIAQTTGLRVACRLNEDWNQGVASSLREASRAATEAGVAGVLVLLVDQHRIAASDLRRLHGAWLEAGRPAACRARHGDYAGPPVILSAVLFDELSRLQGDQGARAVLARLDSASLVEVPLPNAADDLDVPSQLATLQSGSSGASG